LKHRNSLISGIYLLQKPLPLMALAMPGIKRDVLLSDFMILNFGL